MKLSSGWKRLGPERLILPELHLYMFNYMFTSLIMSPKLRTSCPAIETQWFSEKVMCVVADLSCL